jgi:serine protease Do
MLRQCFLFAAVVLCCALAGRADTVVLRDNASVTGKILAEKKDVVVVDVGYTALTIPWSQVSKIVRGEAPATQTSSAPAAQAQTTTPAKPATPAVAESKADPPEEAGFYSRLAKPPPASNVRDLVKLLGEAVVQVRTPGSLGSGFVLNEDGFLITNFHVIEGETQISVEVYHQDKGELTRKAYKQVRIVAMNKFDDLALLRIEDKDAPRFKHVSLGSAEALAVGDHVFAIGSPLGLERTVTEGILSTKTRPMGGQLYLQTTTQINPGNSGGPLFNLGGEVIGVTNMKIAAGEGLGFAIPIESVKYFLDHRDAFAYANDNPSSAYHYLEPPSRAHQRPQTPD